MGGGVGPTWPPVGSWCAGASGRDRGDGDVVVASRHGRHVRGRTDEFSSERRRMSWSAAGQSARPLGEHMFFDDVLETLSETGVFTRFLDKQDAWLPVACLPQHERSRACQPQSTHALIAAWASAGSVLAEYRRHLRFLSRACLLLAIVPLWRVVQIAPHFFDEPRSVAAKSMSVK